MFFKSLTAFFATTTICLAGFAVFLYFNQKTPLEKRKIQVFEPFVLETIKASNKLSGDSKSESKAANIGLDNNGNLYMDVLTMKLDDDLIPLTISKSRLTFTCDNFDGRIIGVKTNSTCEGNTVSTEPEYIETSVRDHFKEVYEQNTAIYDEFVKEIKAAYGEGNYIEHEDGTWEQNTDNLSEEEMNQIQEKLAEVRAKYNEKTNALEEYDDLINNVWKDYLNK